MNDEKSQSVDLFGIKPVADSINTVTKTTAEFLTSICKPAAEEFGFLFQDTVRYWRLKNISNIAFKSKGILEIQNDGINLSASPRIVHNILENGSWIDNDMIQEMWAGLLTSACTKEGKDESNLIFIHLLNQLTFSEVKILNYCSKEAEKSITHDSLIYAKTFTISLDILLNLSGVMDIHQLDRELDHLRSLELLSINSGFEGIEMPEEPKASENVDVDVTPTGLALNMYSRCNGSLQTPIEYFGLQDRTLEHQP